MLLLFSLLIYYGIRPAGLTDNWERLKGEEKVYNEEGPRFETTAILPVAKLHLDAAYYNEYCASDQYTTKKYI